MTARIEELFYSVVDLSPDARARFFSENHIDLRTREELEALIAFDSPSSTALEADIGQLAMRTLVRYEATDLPCGPYRLGSILGRGGMGNVYLAERTDGEVSQRVAVKLLQPGGDDPELRERFLAERQILASLSQPHIARLLDAGHREDGQPYLVMEYVEGEPIDVYTAGMGLRRKLALFLKVCAAVSYLHRNLVVHRDLKPANILVTNEDEPKLLDFGIAKLLHLTRESDVSCTRSLTPDYASPEQVSGGPITTATDIYSLGAVLYKVLTGVTPHQFEGDSAGAIAFAVSSGTITPPSKLPQSVKGDLELVLMKALRKEPQERYASVEALANDVRAYLERRPVAARSSDMWYRTRKWLWRYWVPAAAAAPVIASLATGLFIATQERAIAAKLLRSMKNFFARSWPRSRNPKPASRTRSACPASTQESRVCIAASDATSLPPLSNPSGWNCGGAGTPNCQTTSMSAANSMRRTTIRNY